MATEEYTPPASALELLCQRAGVPYTKELRKTERDLITLARLGELASFVATLREEQPTIIVSTGHESTLEQETPPIDASSIPSEKHAWRNEDAYFTLQRNGAQVAGVFDGLGGHPGSERASWVAADVARTFLEETVEHSAVPEVSAETLRTAVRFANDGVAREAGGNHRSIATTAALASLHTHPETGQLYAAIAWAGDSRVYIIRNGEVLYSTLDDYTPPRSSDDEIQPSRRQVQDFLETFADPEEYFDEANDLNRLAARLRNYISNCLDGANNTLRVNADTQPLRPGDRVLLVTDGISDNLTRDEIGQCATTRELIQKALERSRNEEHLRAKPDDMTAIILEVPSLPLVLPSPADRAAMPGMVQNEANMGHTYICFSCGQSSPHWNGGGLSGCMYCGHTLGNS